MVIPEENVVPVPDEINYDDAAVVEPSCVVVHGYDKTNLQPGDTVAVIGCGTIGLLAVQWAKVFGAQKVIAIDIDQLQDNGYTVENKRTDSETSVDAGLSRESARP